jgi:dienelactone hydrolase/predicted neuraminidase
MNGMNAFLRVCLFSFSAFPLVGASEEIETVIAAATEESPRNSEGDVIVLKDGTLLAAWSEFYGGNRDDSAGRISAKQSGDGGRTWGKRWTMVENTGQENVMSVSFLRLNSGEILLFYLEKNSRSDLDVLVRRSGDEGKTWSEPVTVTQDAGYWVMNNARVVQLSSGRIVCPTAMTEQVWVKGHVFRTVCFYSDDEGKTWRRGVGGVVAPKRGAMEPGLIERADGSLLQYIRTQTGKQWFSVSKNGADTWSESAPWTVVSPEAPASLAKLPGDRGWVIFCNPNIDESNSHLGKRTPLVAMTSLDEGRTWSKAKAIETDPAKTYSYTSVDFHEDRVLLTYYESDEKNRISWKFRSFPLEWLPAAPAPVRLDRDDLMQFRATDGTRKPVETVEDWKKRRAEIVRGMESVMGPFPGKEKRVDLEIAIEEEADAGSYLRRRISYQSESGARTPAYLCIPKVALEAGGKVPAVLCLHPTDNVNGHKVVVGLGGKENRQYAAELAERGFVTISPSYPHLAGYHPNLEELGYLSGTMKAIWDNSRALDVLESLPFVETGKGVGAIGHSLGGHNAIYTAVFEERISAVVSSCGFDAYPDYYDGEERVWYFGKGWCQIRYMPRMADYRGRLNGIPFDFTEMLGALAPRPVFVNAPLHDSNFRWKSVDRCVAAAGPAYRLTGAEGGIEVEHPDCDHDFPDEMRERAYSLFESVLK